MAINKDSNGYTFGFAIIMVAIVGSILASLAMGLKQQKKDNEEVKKKMDILSAFLDLEKEGITRDNAIKAFEDNVYEDKSIVLDNNGKVKKGINGKDVLKMTNKLLNNDFYDYVGSDIHHLNHVKGFYKKVKIDNLNKFTQLINKNINLI